jgi:hypothetical protein
MPAVPGDAGTLEYSLHFPLIASVQVKRMTGRIGEDRARQIAITPDWFISGEPLVDD